MIADIVVIIAILLCTFLGYKRGLIKVAVKILSFVIALIVALVLYMPISNYIIENTDLVSKIENVIEDKLVGQNEEPESKPEEDTNYLEAMENYIVEGAQNAKEDISESLSNNIAIAIVRIGTWIVLFIVIKIAMLFIKLFADAIAQIPIIKQFNKARRDYIRSIRRISINICCTCGFKHGISNVWRK